MPTLTDRLPSNVAGAYYVDATCIDCDLCRNTAPAFFQRDADLGQSIVHHQPLTTDERALAEEARLSCPTESIGHDGT